MKTITIDILNEKALDLLRDLESLKIIRMRNKDEVKSVSEDLVLKYKGRMSKQPLNEVDSQLNDLRDGWE